MPMPKQTRHIVDGCRSVAAERTIRNIDVAKGTPKDSGRFVTRMKTVPLFFNVYAFADSEADVDDAGYSPPVPKPGQLLSVRGTLEDVEGFPRRGMMCRE